MLAHRLRHRVTFQRQVSIDEGQFIRTEWQNAWIDSEIELVDVPAEVLTGPGREWVGSGTVNAETSARITLRWFPGLMPSWRVLWDGRVFNIQSIETDRTGCREWRLRCMDGPGEGK